MATPTRHLCGWLAANTGAAVMYLTAEPGEVRHCGTGEPAMGHTKAKWGLRVDWGELRISEKIKSMVRSIMECIDG